MRTTILAAALTLASPLAFAQAPPPPITLTYAQVQALSSGLRTLDDGSVDQCASRPAEPAPKPGVSPPPPQPCPYTKSVPLLVAMARDMVAIQGPMTAFSNAQEALRKEVLGDPKLKGDQAKQVAAFTPRIQELLDTKVQLYSYETINLADLNLAQNKVSATTLAQLSPLIPELRTKQPPK